MGRRLSTREMKALAVLSKDRRRYLIKDQFPPDIGKRTLEGLVGLGLAEIGPSIRYPGKMGYKITADGWRAQFGLSFQEVIESERRVRPLTVMHWPIE
jgi:hypothetical protein